MIRPSTAAVLVCAALAAGALAFAQQDPSAEQQQRRAAELAKAPDAARSRRNPLETDPEAVAAGRKLFEQRCLECHGANTQGGRKGPNLRQEGVQSAPPGVLFWFLTNGNVRHGMPPWSKLPEPQHWQLVSFLKSLGTDGNPVPRCNRVALHRSKGAKPTSPSLRCPRCFEAHSGFAPPQGL